MLKNRCIRYGLVVAGIVWAFGLFCAVPASAAAVMNVLKGQGTNPLYDFGMAVGISGGNKFIAGDFDGDGDTDIANRNQSNTGVQYWRNNGDGTFAELSGASNPFKDVTFAAGASNFSATYLLTGDFDGDGDVDVFNENHVGQPALYRNDGGSFTILQGAGTNPLHAFGTALGGGNFRAIAADFDGDGDTDLVNRNSTSTGVQYWRNNGDGTWTELTGATNPLASATFPSNISYFTAQLLATGDFDGDGDIDIFNSNHGGSPAMYRNDGATFTVLQGAGTNPLHDFGMTVGATNGKFVAGDFNGDGLVDAASRNAANTGVQFWKNNGDGTFTEQTGSNNPFDSASFTANVNYFYAPFLGVGDFDGDGDTDIVNVNDGGAPALYQQSGFPSNSLRQYPVRAGAVPSDSYTLSVNGQNVFVEKFGDISFARFSFSGTANVQVNASEAIASFGISPQSYQINGTSAGNAISFAINEPKTLIVSVNNLEKLFLFADGIETDAPDVHGPNVINLADYLPANRDEDAEVTQYFQQAIDDTSAMNNGAGGILYVPDGKYMTAQLKLKSNVHLYLQDGAWIRAVPEFNETNYPAQNNGDSSFIFIGNASHVSISGRGIIDGNGMTIRTSNSSANIKLLRTAEVTDLHIEDVYFMDSARWSFHLLYAQDVVLKHIKLINDLRGAPDPNDPNVWIPTVTNTDGVDIDASQHVTVDGAFIYTGDDSISPKVTGYLNLKRPTLDVHITNNVMWSLKSALKVGDETLMDIGDISFENNDIIWADRFIALWNREETRIHNIDATNNRAEHIGGNYNERYFYFRIRTNGADSKPGWIDQVRVKDFYALNTANQPSSIEGYDTSHLVTNVTFDNIVINGSQAQGITDVPLDFKNAFYNNVVFQPSGTVYSGTSLPSTVRIVSPNPYSATSNPAPAISGTATAASTVKLYLDDAAPISLTADVEGNWSYTPADSLAEGSHTVKAAEVGADGNEDQVSDTVSFTIDWTAPAAPSIDTPANNSHTGNAKPLISGTAEPGSAVQVYIDQAAPASVHADGSGNWSYTPTTALSSGSHSVKAIAIDPAGNESEYSTVVNFTADVASPIATTSVEAEAMTLTGYTVEAQSVASGGKVIKVSGTGTAAAQLAGQSGTYDLKVDYFDENDGVATYRLFVNGNQVDAWSANMDFGSASVSDKSRTSRIITGIPLRKWDTVTLEGTANASEAARVDKLEFMLMALPDSSSLGSVLGTVTNENGTPLAGVNVQATGVDVPQTVYQDYTNSSGQYAIEYVPAGTYTISMHKDGYIDNSAQGILVSANSAAAPVNLALQTGPNPPQLTTVQVSGSIQTLTAGGAGYDLSGLTVTGQDQYGNANDLTGLTKSWALKTGSGYAVLDGSTLFPLEAGSGTISLTVNGIESNPVVFTVQAAVNNEPRVLLVDRRGVTGGAYGSIAEAVASTPALKPGDIISLVPGSGPYHETIRLHASGAPGNPIIFDGNGELISGFSPFQFTHEPNGQWTYTLPAPIANTDPNGNSNTFRYLVEYNGQRLLLDQAYGQNAGVFTSDYAVLSSDGTKLILNPDKASPTAGWEISTQENGVEIVTPDSYQTYRNLRITGVQNDGFNVHGTGSGLVFENVEAFHNFDEGFSSHDSTNSTIEGGKFWGNENGIYNMSRDTVTFTANHVQVYDNIGYGVATQMGTNSFSDVQVWDNGISNVRVGGRVNISNVVTYESRWTKRPWVGYQEAQNYSYNQQVKPYAYSEYVKPDYPIVKSGTPTVLPASELPPFKGPFDDWRHIYFSIVQQSDPTVSGPAADPDGDGLSNQEEYEEGLDPNHYDEQSSAAVNTSLQGPASVQAGQTLDLTFGLLGVTSGVYAQQATFTYNPDQLQYVGADSLLDDFSVVGATNGNGRIDIVEAGFHVSVTGSANLLALHFKAMVPMQTISSQVYASNVIVSDQNGNESELRVGPAYQVQIVVSAADKTALQAEIAEAQTKLSGASVGNNWGQFGQQAVDAFNSAIQQAITITNDIGATQTEVDQAAADLASAVQVFTASMKTAASIGDLGIMASRYGIFSTDADWSVVQRYDFNGDNKLDIVDLAAMAKKILGN